MKHIIKKHVESMEKAYDKLARHLPGHESWWKKYEWPLLILGWILVLAGFIWVWNWDGGQRVDEPESDQPVVEQPVDTEKEIATRAGVRGVVMSRALSGADFTQAVSLIAPEAVFGGLAIAEYSFQNLLTAADNVPVVTAEQLSYWRVFDSDMGVEGAQLGLTVATSRADYDSAAARLTQILAEVKQPLASDSFFTGRVTNPPTEIQAARADIETNLYKAFAALEETRQIELYLKGQYQMHKDERDALAQQLTTTINNTQAPNVTAESAKYQLLAAETARLEAQFDVYQKLEVDYRAVTKALQQRLNYIDKHFNDLALGLCDWNSCS